MPDRRTRRRPSGLAAALPTPASASSASAHSPRWPRPPIPTRHRARCARRLRLANLGGALRTNPPKVRRPRDGSPIQCPNVWHRGLQGAGTFTMKPVARGIDRLNRSNAFGFRKESEDSGANRARNCPGNDGIPKESRQTSHGGLLGWKNLRNSQFSYVFRFSVKPSPLRNG